MSTIQYIDKERRELLEDLREIARSYQPLKETDHRNTAGQFLGK